LYWGDHPFEQLITLFDSASLLFRNKPADKYFVYGSLYTFVILFLGIKFIFKYRHSRHQVIRTVVVIFSQLVFAYFIPNILEALNYNSAEIIQNGQTIKPGYFNANPINSWPLHAEYSSFDVNTLKVYSADAYQPIGMAYFVWGIIMFLVITPIVTYFVGKRWYCSWFCGCGGLAETAGDGFRHLSNKSVKAWKIERWVIHSVMVFVLIMTLAVMLPYFFKSEFSIGFVTLNKHVFMAGAILVLGALLFFFIKSYKKQTIKSKYLAAAIVTLVIIMLLIIIAYFTGNSKAFFLESRSIKKAYGFFIGSVFSGVIGVGFYPILGNRVWCRFGCPMAGYMGLVQRFHSKFRITTNGGQCISCGNCSTYCEQGIDVRAYAQRGENIVRASCVGCGVCSAVCPRGVLKLENGPVENRLENNMSLIDQLKR
jgi:polyferredoxin